MKAASRWLDFAVLHSNRGSISDNLGRNMRRVMKTILATAGALAILIVSGVAARPDDRAELLKVREAVWAAWFTNDTKTLEALVPPDTIVISAGEEKWKNQADILQSAAKFQAQGGKLIRLEFQRTEIQRFGDVAITYSQYLYETEVDGKRSVTSGRVTEIFVLRHGKWTNPGWHTDTEK
jgi:ketosteroid isomerase-like protein